MRNFGRSIGSKGWTTLRPYGTRDLGAVLHLPQPAGNRW